MIGIIDYGSGNLRAISNRLRRLRVESITVKCSEDLQDCTGLILPGVGDFDACRQKLVNSSFYSDFIDIAQNQKIPILGICIGMHLLAHSSEEGKENGLSLVEGKVIKFLDCQANTIVLPHMGWNSVSITEESPLFRNINTQKGFYFIHNYHYSDCVDSTSATSYHGYNFPVAVQRGLIFGVQFHPEKSHRNGHILFENFVNIVRDNVAS